MITPDIYNPPSPSARSARGFVRFSAFLSLAFSLGMLALTVLAVGAAVIDGNRHSAAWDHDNAAAAAHYRQSMQQYRSN